jgi:hypothetical protein
MLHWRSVLAHLSCMSASHSFSARAFSFRHLTLKKHSSLSLCTPQFSTRAKTKKWQGVSCLHEDAAEVVLKKSGQAEALQIHHQSGIQLGEKRLLIHLDQVLDVRVHVLQHLMWRRPEVFKQKPVLVLAQHQQITITAAPLKHKTVQGDPHTP